MKKGWKIFWVICGSALGFGLILCIAGAVMGATFAGVRDTYGTKILYESGDFSHIDGWAFSHRDGGGHIDAWYDSEDWYDTDDLDELEDLEDFDDYDGAGYIRSSQENVSEFPGIRELDVDVTYLQIIVAEGAGDSVIVDASEVNSQLRDKLIYAEENGELKIETTSHSIWKKLGKNGVGKLVIRLPKDRALEDVSFEIGAGQLTIESIKSGCLDISVGAGQAVAKQFEVKDLNVECGAGQTKLNGTATRKVEAECGVGEIVMIMGGRQSDYNYELKCSVGTLNVGNDNYSGLGTKRRIDNGAAKQMDVDCGIGKVEISFSEEL